MGGSGGEGGGGICFKGGSVTLEQVIPGKTSTRNILPGGPPTSGAIYFMTSQVSLMSCIACQTFHFQ